MRSGPFNFYIRSRIAAIVDNVEQLYSHYEIAETNDFGDFHIAVQPPSYSPRRFLRKQAEFYVDGEAVFNPFPMQHATAMLEWGMNWCVSTQIHTYLIIHAAVVEKNGFAAVLPAPPGSGKSTLCASLVLEGWRLLSDELTMLDLSSGYAVPLPRPVGLKNQSIHIIKARHPEAVFGFLSSDTQKGSVCHLKPPADSISQQYLTVPVGWVVFPRYVPDADVKLQIKPKGRAFMEIADNSFNFSLLGMAGFEVLKTVIGRADCFSFEYSRLDDAIETFNSLGVPLHDI